MKEVTKEVYLKWYEDMLESLRTNLRHYTSNKKLEDFTFIQRSRSGTGCFARHGLDKG
jgi:hypothetical protein